LQVRRPIPTEFTSVMVAMQVASSQLTEFVVQSVASGASAETTLENCEIWVQHVASAAHSGPGASQVPAASFVDFGMLASKSVRRQFWTAQFPIADAHVWQSSVVQAVISCEHIVLMHAPNAPPSPAALASTPSAFAYMLISACVQKALASPASSVPDELPDEVPEVEPDDDPEVDPELPPPPLDELEQAQITNTGASRAPKRITLRIYDAS
jgi:hypothetical protein